MNDQFYTEVFISFIVKITPVLNRLYEKNFKLFLKTL